MLSSVPDHTAREPERTRRPRRDDVRRRLLDAALTEFIEHGYDRASLDRIALTAGFSKGAIYSNFTGKEDLFLALMDEQVRHRVGKIRDLVARTSASTQADIAGQVGRTLTALIVDDADWQLLFLDYVTHSARDRAAHSTFADRRRTVRTLIATAAHDLLGADHPLWQRLSPDTFALTLLALSNGIAIERIADPDSIPEQLLGQLLGVLTN